MLMQPGNPDKLKLGNSRDTGIFFIIILLHKYKAIYIERWT